MVLVVCLSTFVSYVMLELGSGRISKPALQRAELRLGFWSIRNTAHDLLFTMMGGHSCKGVPQRVVETLRALHRFSTKNPLTGRVHTINNVLYIV